MAVPIFKNSVGGGGYADPTKGIRAGLVEMRNAMDSEERNARLASIDARDQRRYELKEKRYQIDSEERNKRLAAIDARDKRRYDLKESRYELKEKRYQQDRTDAKQKEIDNLKMNIYKNNNQFISPDFVVNDEVQDKTINNLVYDNEKIKNNTNNIPLAVTQEVDGLTNKNKNILDTFNFIEEKYKNDKSKINFEKLNAIRFFDKDAAKNIESNNIIEKIDTDMDNFEGNVPFGIEMIKKGYDYFNKSEAERIEEEELNSMKNKRKKEKSYNKIEIPAGASNREKARIKTLNENKRSNIKSLSDFDKKVSGLRNKEEKAKKIRDINKKEIEKQEKLINENYMKFGDKTNTIPRIATPTEADTSIKNNIKRAYDSIDKMKITKLEKLKRKAALNESIATSKNRYNTLRDLEKLTKKENRNYQDKVNLANLNNLAKEDLAILKARLKVVGRDSLEGKALIARTLKDKSVADKNERNK